MQRILPQEHLSYYGYVDLLYWQLAVITWQICFLISGNLCDCSCILTVNIIGVGLNCLAKHITQIAMH